MRLAIPVYQNKVAPRFDCAEEFMIVDIDKIRSEVKKILRCSSDYPLERAVMLADSDVDVVVCGAIDQYSSRILMVKGKRLYPWQSGCIEDILRRFWSGEYDAPPKQPESTCRPAGSDT